MKKNRLPRSMKMKLPLQSITDVQDTGFSLEVDLPGVLPEDLKVTVENDEIVLTAKRLDVPFGARYRYNVARFDPATVDAELALGVLQVTMAPRPTVGTISVAVTAITSSISGSV